MGFTGAEAEGLLSLIAEIRTEMKSMNEELHDKMDTLIIKTNEVRSLARKTGGQVDPVEPDLAEPNHTHIDKSANPSHLELGLELDVEQAPYFESHQSVPVESVEPNPRSE